VSVLLNTVCLLAALVRGFAYSKRPQLSSRSLPLETRIAVGTAFDITVEQSQCRRLPHLGWHVQSAAAQVFSVTIHSSSVRKVPLRWQWS